MSAQVAVDLRAAAEVLRRDGWTQRIYHGPGGCHCAEGAIAVAVGQHVYDEAVPDVLAMFLDVNWWALSSERLWSRREKAERAVREVIDDTIINFNDEPGRTADEVIAALEAAADAAEATS